MGELKASSLVGSQRHSSLNRAATSTMLTSTASLLLLGTLVACTSGVTESIGECFPGYYQCETGVCIPGNLVCNGDMNCQTGDDEANCSDKSEQEGECFPGYYQCDTGVCIPEYLVCKGEMNCQP